MLDRPAYEGACAREQDLLRRCWRQVQVPWPKYFLRLLGCQGCIRTVLTVSVNIAQGAMWPRRLNLAVVADDERNLGEDAGAMPGWALHTQGPVYRGDAICQAAQPGSVARSSADPVIRDRYQQPLLFEAQRDLD